MLYLIMFKKDCSHAYRIYWKFVFIGHFLNAVICELICFTVVIVLTLEQVFETYEVLTCFGKPSSHTGVLAVKWLRHHRQDTSM